MASESDSPNCAHSPDENQPRPTLGSPWTPLPNFRAWDSSKQTGPDLLTAQDCQIPIGFSSASTPSESPPILLKFRNTANNLGQTLNASHSHVYEPPSLTPQSVWGECKQKVLKAIADARRSPLDLILDILDPSQDEYEHYRLRWFSPSCNKLSGLLDRIFAHSKGRDLVLHWTHPHSLESVCATVASEMDLVVKELSLTSVEHVSTEFISSWTLEKVIEPATQLCPSLLRILEAAAQTKEAKCKNKIKFPKTTCSVVVSQLAYQRSNRCVKFQSVFGLFLWSTGSSRKTIDVLFRCGLTISYDSIAKLLSRLSQHCITLAKQIVSSPHMFCYDNINISSSIFVEQRGGATPAKVQSGTFGILYGLRNATLDDLKLQPIMNRYRNCNGLSPEDLRLSLDQLKCLNHQFSVIVLRVLFKHCHLYSEYSSDPALQPIARRPLAPNSKTEQFPLRATTIEESSIHGNLLVHEDAYLVQLKRVADDLVKYAIPSVNDQSTNARIRGGQVLRIHDRDPWARRDVFQLGFGLFHLCMNLIWALLHVHRGSLQQTGSLTYFFALMEKARLGAEHPDYHTLSAALTQVLEGIILAAWLDELGDLADFAKTNPSAQDLLLRAQRILNQCTCPLENWRKGSKAKDPPVPPYPGALDPLNDIAHQNTLLLTRDLLYMIELTSAISEGDFGRVEDLLPTLAKMFRGAGSNNYCTEILHFLTNLKHIWTPKFADIMRDNMIVNVSGLPGHFMAVDLNIEHLIGYLKMFFVAKGLRSTWDKLGDISGAVIQLQNVKKQVSKALGASYEGKTHTTPDTSALVWKVANEVRELLLGKYQPGRKGNDKQRLVTNLVDIGERRLLSSSLETFNKRLACMKAGNIGEMTGITEDDEIPSVQLTVEFDDVIT
ncbi:hypothetical protein F5888DRAFT_1917408 [Russula emetica]|nr:hypothetical protein F5888DRAFT_1917408 [Russula emetica]